MTHRFQFAYIRFLEHLPRKVGTEIFSSHILIVQLENSVIIMRLRHEYLKDYERKINIGILRYQSISERFIFSYGTLVKCRKFRMNI